MRRVVLFVSAVAVLGLGALVAVEADKGRVDALSVVGLILALITLLIEVVGLLRVHDVAAPSVSSQADNLAEILVQQWQEEADAHQLRDPRVLPLAWAQTRRDVSDSNDALVDGAGKVVRLNLDGRMDGRLDEVARQLAAGYHRVPSGRLVLLGEPGAGKSVLALLLTLGLLRNRTDERPVPILLSASSWDPLSEDMDTWIAESLAVSHYSGRSDIPRRLLANDLLLPIIDGLDEIPESGRRTAIRAINRAIRRDRPVVVTCRSVEYQDLIGGGAPVLRRAPVVEIAPVPVKEAIEYLRSVDWPVDAHWDAVFAHMTQVPGSPVAEALSTPLMLSLAKSIYQQTGNPAELLDTANFDTRHSIEDHLADAAIDAAYTSPRAVGRGRRRDPDVADARRWLTFLARYLHHHRERDLLWWLLGQRLHSAWVGPAVGIAGGIALMIGLAGWMTTVDADGSDPYGTPATVGLMGPVVTGAYVGASFAVLLMVIWYAASGRAPGRLSFSMRGSVGRLRRGFLTGLGVAALVAGPILLGVAVVLTIGDAWSLANIEAFLAALVATAFLAFVIGAAVAVHNWLDAPPERAAQASPLNLIRQDRLSSWVGALAAGLVMSLLVFPCGLLGMLVGSLAAKSITSWAGWPGDPDVGAVADARLYDVNLRFFGSTAFTIGMTVVLPGVVMFLLVFFTRAWPRFVLLRMVLAVRGQLPWHLPAFLADARERGLLRQSGGAYQFRHVRLQERLANQPLDASAPDGRAPAVGSATPRRLDRRVAWAAAALAVVALVASASRIPADTSRATLNGSYGGGSYTFEFAPGGRTLATYKTYEPYDNVRLWDTATGRLRSTLDTAEVIEFSTDARLLIGYDANRFRTIWDAVTGQRLLADREILSAKFLAGGQTLAMLLNSQAGIMTELWDTRMRRTLRVVAGEALLDARIVVSVEATGVLHVWDAASGRFVMALTEVEGGTSAVTVSPGSRTLAVQDKDSVRLWRAETGEFVGRLAPFGHRSTVHFSPDGTKIVELSSVSSGNFRQMTPGETLRLWDAETARLIAAHTGARGFNEVHFSADSGIIAGDEITAAGDERPRFMLWEAGTGRPIATIPDTIEHKFVGERGLAVRRGGAEPADGVVELRDAFTGQVLASHRSPDWSTNAAYFLANGDALYLFTRGLVQVWEVDSGATLAAISTPPQVSDVDVSPDGRRLAIADSNGIRLWDDRGQLIGQLSRSIVDFRGFGTGCGNGSAVVLFSPDARTLTMYMCGDDKVRLWDVNTGDLLATFLGHAGPIGEIAYNDDGSMLVTSGVRDDTVRLWAVPR